MSRSSRTRLRNARRKQLSKREPSAGLLAHRLARIAYHEAKAYEATAANLASEELTPAYRAWLQTLAIRRNTISLLLLGISQEDAEIMAGLGTLGSPKAVTHANQLLFSAGIRGVDFDLLKVQ